MAEINVIDEFRGKAGAVSFRLQEIRCLVQMLIRDITEEPWAPIIDLLDRQLGELQELHEAGFAVATEAIKSGQG